MFGKLKGLFGGANAKEIEVASPAAGKIIPLAEVSDPTFAQGILGQGAAVMPEEGRVIAPADGTVDMMFETGHAVSMTTADGVELLIHIGIDTVQLEGRHYTARCKTGDQVKKGQTLIEFDPAAIQADGYDIVIPVIVCNTDAFAAVRAEPAGAVAAGGALLRIEQK